MERRGRSKSRNRKNATAKSPRPKKAVGTSPAVRGRPRKKEEDKKEVVKRKTAASPSRSRSRSVSLPRKRQPSRTRRVSKKKEEDLDDDLPSVVLNDIVKNKNLGSQLDDIIRRSMSREIAADTLRRSSRFSEKFTSLKKETWTEQSSSIEQTKRLEKASNLGSWIGPLIFVIGFNLTIGALLLGCTKDQCELKAFFIPRNWRVYFNLEAAAAIVSFIVLQTVLSILPTGRVVQSNNGISKYRANGFLALIISGLIVGGAWYLKYPVTAVYEKWIPGAVTAAILALFFAIALYLKGGRAPVAGLNLHGNSGNFINDFVLGREINPIVYGVNIKILLLRIAIIGAILSDAMYLLKSYELRREISPTLATLVGLKALYYLDGLWFEESFSSTFEVQYEGTGLMVCQGYLLYPFFTGVLTRFVLQRRIELSPYSLAASVIVFLIGFTLYRASNLQKAAFRKNPKDPAVANLQTINTSRGKKLLVSGWWGKVKHPNYLGDIILHWAMATTVGFTHVIPYFIPLITTVFLIHRAARDDRRCSNYYLAAWSEYSKRVPYRILPRIY